MNFNKLHNICDSVKVTDSSSAERALEGKARDLYIDGSVTVQIPEGEDPNDFFTQCSDYLNDNWGEPDVNFDYGDLNLSFEVNGDGTMTIKNTTHVSDAVSLNVGDPYDDGVVSGKIKEISNDGLVVEAQNEDGDVQDVPISLSDSLKNFKKTLKLIS